MSNVSNSNIKEITYISIGVATLIAGGFTIFQLSLAFPIPGVKYILMSPYLSMVIYILLSKIKSKFALFKIGCTLGLIMMMINLYMGITIILTALLSQLSIFYQDNRNRAFYGAVLFSTYAGLCALFVSKYIIGGVFKEMSNLWFVYTGLICLIFGILGTILAKKIIKHLIRYTYDK